MGSIWRGNRPATPYLQPLYGNCLDNVHHCASCHCCVHAGCGWHRGRRIWHIRGSTRGYSGFWNHHLPVSHYPPQSRGRQGYCRHLCRIRLSFSGARVFTGVQDQVGQILQAEACKSYATRRLQTDNQRNRSLNSGILNSLEM